MLLKVAESNLGPLQDSDVQTIFREVISACRALEKRVIVAYLGPAGTFSEQAVYQQFGHAVESPCLACRLMRYSVRPKLAPLISA